LIVDRLIVGLFSDELSLMRVCFDARMMGPRNSRGIGRYAEEILRAMLELNSGHRFVLLERDPASSSFAGHPDVEHVSADIQWYTLKEQFALPRLIASAHADLLHVPHWNVSIFPTQPRPYATTPRIITIHDLILLEEPASANVTTRGPLVAGVKRIGHRIVLRNALYRSREILVPTEHVKERIAFHCPDLKTPVTVTGEGMPDVDESAWADPDLEHPYFLTVGSAYPHKNLDLVVDAWRTIAERHPGVKLIVVGKKDQFMEKLESRVTSQELQEDRQTPSRLTRPNAKRQTPPVEFRGDVSDEDLKLLYSRSHALIFPSRWEGIGLPPLEALAFGCPVISSDASCMPEVLGGEGILYFNPASADGIVRAVEEVLRNPSGVRGEARRIVPALRKRHDWKAAATRTLEAYERARRR
jgi:glycosyltransferase involved in cell wall biosynthesis